MPTEETVTISNARDDKLSFLPLHRRSLSLSLVLEVLALLLLVHSKLKFVKDGIVGCRGS
jgi:hypothetical protein